MSENFDAGWLTLREPFDHAARNHALAMRLVGALPVKPRLIDLGAGTGSLFRYLAPMIDGAQSWTFIDADPALLDEAFNVTADWADGLGYRISGDDSALTIHAPGGDWVMDGELHDLAAIPGGLAFREADAVVCSALLDLVSVGWITWLAGTLRVPFYAALSVDGRDGWLPFHPVDAVMRAGFRRDQRRNKGFGRALGTGAIAEALRAFSTLGFRVSSAPADWMVPRTALAMLDALIVGGERAAVAALPAQRHVLSGWREARHAQAMGLRLAVRIGHRDILALPK
ncbi:MAG: class I SAM-dependent methyltransferase [Acetobacteraceae bacterium]|nr:class I SAM-dependent methyltransferase [Acetobacteraceae bacterium]